MTSAIDEHLGIAVVDDDAVFREVTCAMLSSRSGFIPFPASSSDELLDVLAEQRIDCIVLDYDFGNYTGLSIKEKIDQLFPEPPPIVMLTGDGRESTVIKAFRMGVNDYVPKHSLQPKALVSTIARVVTNDRERLQKSTNYQRLVDAADIDLVSGLFSRLHLDARLRQLLDLPSDNRRSYAVIAIELVELQSIIQNVGLRAGDAAIRAFGKLLKTLTRSEDICGRYSQGTFVIIADVKGNVELLQTICQRLATNLSLKVDLSAAQVVLNGCVAGALCDRAVISSLEPACMLDTVFASLSQAKEIGQAYRISGPSTPSSTQDAGASSSNAKALSPPKVLPAAEQLRTGDRRSEARQRVLKRGVVHLFGTQSTFNCTVRNLSAGGAGLRLETPFAAPAEFQLEIMGSGARRRVAVRWQTGVDFGVAYLPD